MEKDYAFFVKYKKQITLRLCVQPFQLQKSLPLMFLFLLFLMKPTPAANTSAGNLKFKGLSKTSRMKLKWTHVGLVFFIMVSLVMTGCFFWQYQLPKLLPGECEAASHIQTTCHLLHSEHSDRTC